MLNNEMLVLILGSNLVVAISTTILSKVFSRKKDRLDIIKEYQGFHKNYIAELKQKVADLTNNVFDLTNRVESLLKVEKKNRNTIEQQRKNILKWEGYCIELKKSIEGRDRLIVTLQEEIDLIKEK